MTVENEGPFRKTCIIATSFVTNPTWTTLGLNPGIRVEKRPPKRTYGGWNFNSGNYLFTTGTK